MSLLDEYVQISITRQTLGLDPISLDTLLVIGNTKKDVEGWARVKEYGSLAEVSVDYDANSKERKVAALYFGQELRPTKILIGQVLGEETFKDAYPIIALANSNFYGVTITSDTQQDILDVAELVQADGYRMFGVSSNDPKTLVADDETHIIYKLKAKGYDRAFTVFNSAESSFAEAAWFGLMLTKNAGSATWAFKNLKGVQADKLTADNRAQITKNKSNFYTSFGGKDVMLEGKACSGEFIDTMISIDWITTQMKLAIGNALVSSDKIPFTNYGIGIIESIVRNTLKAAGDRGILDSESITVSVPDVRDVPTDKRMQRTLPDVKFEARLAGAIHKVGIQGTLTI